MENSKGNINTSRYYNHKNFKIPEDINITLDKQLAAPFNHIFNIPGKNLRLKFNEAINYWMNIPQEKREIIDSIINYVHNASLILDDLQDNAFLRRGVPSAHTIFGVVNTANAVNYIQTVILQKTFDLMHPEAIKISVEMLLDGLKGQGMEIYWRDNFICPTEEEYNRMAIGKTGAMFTGSLKLFKLFGKAKKPLDLLVETFGLWFQIADDYHSLTNQTYFAAKGFCDDITEGKFNFPIVHAINTYPEEGRLITNILRKRTNDLKLKKRCLFLIDKCGSLEYTRKRLEELTKILFDELEEFDENPLMTELFETVSKYVEKSKLEVIKTTVA